MRGRRNLPKELAEKNRLPWTVFRPDGQQDGSPRIGIHIAKDAGKPCSASIASTRAPCTRRTFSYNAGRSGCRGSQGMRQWGRRPIMSARPASSSAAWIYPSLSTLDLLGAGEQRKHSS